MKIQKTTIISFLLVILISTVTAQSIGGWGIITSNTEAETDKLEESYTLELLNTDNEPVTIQLSATESPDYEVEFEQEIITIEPSATTEDPQGTGWFYRGNGEYVNLTETSFYLNVDEERSTNDIQFNITAQTVTENSEGEIENTQAQIVNQRNFEYKLHINQMLIREINQDQEDGQNETEENQTQTNEDVQKSQTNNQNKTDSQSDKQNDEEQVNKVTLILAGTIFGLVIYILK